MDSTAGQPGGPSHPAGSNETSSSLLLLDASSVDFQSRGIGNNIIGSISGGNSTSIVRTSSVDSQSRGISSQSRGIGNYNNIIGSNCGSNCKSIARTSGLNDAGAGDSSSSRIRSSSSASPSLSPNILSAALDFYFRPQSLPTGVDGWDNLNPTQLNHIFDAEDGAQRTQATPPSAAAAHHSQQQRGTKRLRNAEPSPAVDEEENNIIITEDDEAACKAMFHTKFVDELDKFDVITLAREPLHMLPCGREAYVMAIILAAGKVAVDIMNDKFFNLVSESKHQKLLHITLEDLAFQVLSEVIFEVLINGRVIGSHRIDLKVTTSNGVVILLELKALVRGFKDDNYKQLLNYMVTDDRPLGALMNFKGKLSNVKKIVAKCPTGYEGCVETESIKAEKDNNTASLNEMVVVNFPSGIPPGLKKKNEGHFVVAEKKKGKRQYTNRKTGGGPIDRFGGGQIVSNNNTNCNITNNAGTIHNSAAGAGMNNSGAAIIGSSGAVVAGSKTNVNRKAVNKNCHFHNPHGGKTTSLVNSMASKHKQQHTSNSDVVTSTMIEYGGYPRPPSHNCPHPPHNQCALPYGRSYYNDSFAATDQGLVAVRVRKKELEGIIDFKISKGWNTDIEKAKYDQVCEKLDARLEAHHQNQQAPVPAPPIRCCPSIQSSVNPASRASLHPASRASLHPASLASVPAKASYDSTAAALGLLANQTLPLMTRNMAWHQLKAKYNNTNLPCATKNMTWGALQTYNIPGVISNQVRYPAPSGNQVRYTGTPNDNHVRYPAPSGNQVRHTVPMAPISECGLDFDFTKYKQCKECGCLFDIKIKRSNCNYCQSTKRVEQRILLPIHKKS